MFNYTILSEKLRNAVHATKSHDACLNTLSMKYEQENIDGKYLMWNGLR